MSLSSSAEVAAGTARRWERREEERAVEEQPEAAHTRSSDGEERRLRRRLDRDRWRARRRRWTRMRAEMGREEAGDRGVQDAWCGTGVRRLTEGKRKGERR